MRKHVQYPSLDARPEAFESFGQGPADPSKYPELDRVDPSTLLMDAKTRQAVLDVLNTLNVFEFQGGDDAYILVENTPDVRQRLGAVGVTEEQIERYGDHESFCIASLAFGERYADAYEGGKFILWGPVLEESFRDRVMRGDGTPDDAIRLLQMLDARTQQ